MQGKYHSIGMVGIAARDIESFRGKINMGAELIKELTIHYLITKETSREKPIK